MKAKKIVIGAVSAAMLSLSVCSLAPVVAAGETVQISVATAEAKAGETFSVNVDLNGIPATGIQCCNFSIKYDSSLVTINSVKAGELANTQASKDDPSASMLPVFDNNIDDKSGIVNLIWTTSLSDSSYWMNGSGTFCTINGTVSKDAGNVTIPLEVIATPTDSSTATSGISIGYFNNKEVVKYDVKKTDGEVKVGEGGGGDNTLYGDADEDGEVGINDAVLIMQSNANPDKYALTEQGKKNADVVDGDGVTNSDALAIQYVESRTITPDKFPMTSAELDNLGS
ncbi:MAG: hypothetical protein K2J08_09690 [Ruminococcus sp.]|nr:hypothetical protein [Ruminococcus sp.]